MSDEIKNSGQRQQPQAEGKKEEKEKTPYQLYLEEKNEREKLQETLQGKDKEYQLGLINLTTLRKIIARFSNPAFFFLADKKLILKQLSLQPLVLSTKFN